MLRRPIRPPNACCRATALALCLLASAVCAVPVCAQSSRDPVYVFHTTQGDMRVQLYPDVTPKTVANFLSYVNSGAYNSSFIHRSASNGNSKFVIQGGGYTVDAKANVSQITANGPITSEAHVSNTRGTIAMALSTGPNSGTDEWFFNEEDNSSLLDGTSDGGPFTVFGKIVDSASLSVMDNIGALPVYDASSVYGPAFNQLPLYNYQSGTNVAQSNFVRITSITPAWTATAETTGSDGDTRLLWDRADGAAAFWRLDAGDNFLDQQNYGPFSGWSARSVAAGRDGYTRVLWTNTDGTAALWRLDAQNRFVDQQNYGPYSGYAAAALSVGTDGYTRLLWDNTDGQAAVWLLGPANRYVSQQNYGPFSGWTAASITTGADLKTRLLWTNTDGAAAFWRLDANNNFLDQQNYGPFSGWTAATVSTGADNNTRVLWTNADGQAAFWRLDVTNHFLDQQNYGPYSGFTAQSLTAAPDGTARALWADPNGQFALWGLSGTNAYTGQQNYGPY